MYISPNIPKHIQNFDRFFSDQQWQIITKAAAIAVDHNLRAFAVGGIVRDGILHDHIRQTTVVSPQFPKDIDLVFDGGENAGIKVAIALHELFPTSKLQIHEKFQTAELFFQEEFSFTMDLATARIEHYAYAGANPEVRAVSIEQDLYRRDFTINALAVQIDPVNGTKGAVIDRFDGINDLHQRQIRAIRQGLFAEDPRRLFRAARFAVRLGFAIADETIAEMLATTSSGLHDAIGGARLRAELGYTLAEPKAAQMFEYLENLGALRCIHPDLHLPKVNPLHSFKHQWRRSQYWLNQVTVIQQIPVNKRSLPINLGIELLISYLVDYVMESYSDRPDLAQLNDAINQILDSLNLGLTNDQKLRQINLVKLLANLPSLEFGSPSPQPSQITLYLQRFDLNTLLLAAAKCSPAPRRTIWHYLTKWQMIKAPLTGKDLQKLGYGAGKQMGEILQTLRNAAIDGLITNREQAIAYLNEC